MSSSGPAVLDSPAKSGEPEMRRRRRRIKTHMSPFKVPDSNSILLSSINKGEDQKQEMRRFLALPIEEKTAHATRTMAKLKKELVEEVEAEEEEEEGNEKLEDSKQIKHKAAPSSWTPGRPERKMTTLKRETVTKGSKHNMISVERQKAVLELSLMTKRSEILKMDKAISKEERQLKKLEMAIERDNLNFEAFLRENEKKSVEARTHFEQEAKIKQQKNREIKRLHAEMGIIESELVKMEEILTDYKKYQELLFKLSPSEWQEAQKMKALKVEVLSEKTKEMADPRRNASSPSIRETRPPAAHSTALDVKFAAEQDNSEYEDEPELYFTDPQQLLDLMTMLTEQNLSLIKNSARMEEKLKMVQKSMETTKKKIEKEEEQLTVQVNDMKQRIDKEKARGLKLEQKVQLHVSLSTEDQDKMLHALGEKVSEVHRSCVDDRMINLSTLEKLSNIEKRMSSLLRGLESIPKDKLEMTKKIKDSERRSREREEKLRQQRDKQRERMRRYMERSLADSKKTSGRKLMPRCMPISRKVKVSNTDNTDNEEELQDYLFGSEEDTE